MKLWDLRSEYTQTPLAEYPYLTSVTSLPGLKSKTHQTSTILFPYPAFDTKISTCVWCFPWISLNILAISSGIPTSTLWIEMRRLAASGMVLLISATIVSIPVRLVEYVKAKCTPRVARSRAHVAPILYSQVSNAQQNCKRKRTRWMLLWSMPNAQQYCCPPWQWGKLSGTLYEIQMEPWLNYGTSSAGLFFWSCYYLWGVKRGGIGWSAGNLNLPSVADQNAG